MSFDTIKDSDKVGQDKPVKDGVDAYDQAAGKYVDLVVEGPDKLQESQMPKGSDPSPFMLGPMAPGSR